MAWVPYDKYLENLFTGEHTAFIDHDSDTIKIALVTDSYTPDRANDVFFDDDNDAADVIDCEVSGTNYTQGGNAVGNIDTGIAANVITLDGDDPAVWSQSAAGFDDAKYAILYKDTGTDATSNLIAYHDFGANVGNVAGDLDIDLDTDGIATLGSA